MLSVFLHSHHAMLGWFPKRMLTGGGGNVLDLKSPLSPFRSLTMAFSHEGEPFTGLASIVKKGNRKSTTSFKSSPILLRTLDSKLSVLFAAGEGRRERHHTHMMMLAIDSLERANKLSV